jgi:hypothetical protein
MARQQWKSALIVLCGLAAGCKPAEPPSGPPAAAPSEAPSATPLSSTQQEQQQVALAARDAMAGRLSAKLMEALGSAGPAAAIGVCQQQAPQIASETGEQFQVAIGRTSFRLRNPKNAPPEWARSLVDARHADPQFVALPDGQLGALLPIRLRAECLLCHGPREQVLPEIRDALASHYPEDQATGFDVDELRGWFWVSVPADARLPSTSSAASAEETTEQEGGES